ncbi:hypothetical protein pEaSNUABM54_00041 [Erwinia phage pEa_SNUABM_54]|nr:hypothetical protein pEaSNUABM54_00041 [Erwinia phage pEa_SNUABM_54]
MKNDLDEDLIPYLSRLASKSAKVPLNASNVSYSTDGRHITVTPIAGGLPKLVQGASGVFTYTRLSLNELEAQWGRLRIPAKTYPNFNAFKAAVLQYNSVSLDPSDVTLTFPLDLSGQTTFILTANANSIRLTGKTTMTLFTPAIARLSFDMQASLAGAGRQIVLGCVYSASQPTPDKVSVTLDGVTLTPTFSQIWNVANCWYVKVTTTKDLPNGNVRVTMESSLPVGTGHREESGGQYWPTNDIDYPVVKLYEYTQNTISHPSVGLYNRTRNSVDLTINADALSKNKAAVDISGMFSNANITSIPAGLFDGLGISGAYCAFMYSGITSLPNALFAKATVSGNWTSAFENTNLTAFQDGLFPAKTTITSMARMFYSCTKLATINANVFKHAAATLTNISYAFSNTAFTAVPTGLLDGLTTVDNATYLFEYTQFSSIPNNLFASLKQITSLDGIFSGSQLGGAVPAGLFSGFVNAVSAQNTFTRAKITTIPTDLFKGCTNIRSFNSCFINCAMLTSVPDTLFADCKLITDLSSAFSGCEGASPFPVGILKGLQYLQQADNAFSYFGDRGDQVTVKFTKELLADCKALSSASRMFMACMFDSIEEGAFDSQTSLQNAANFFGGASWSSSGAPITSVPETLFRNCQSLSNITGFFAFAKFKTVPAKLFQNLPSRGGLRSLNGIFHGCSDLTTVPADLFLGMSNVTNIDELFSGYPSRYTSGFTTIPVGLFTPFADRIDSAINTFSCSKVTTLKGTELAGMSNVTTIEGMFSHTPIVSVPAGLFDSMVSMYRAVSLFEGCSKLTTLPASIFSKCVRLSRFNRMFAQCTSLETLVPGWFDKLEGIYEGIEVFAGCTALTTVPSKLFPPLTNIMDLTSMFNQCVNLKLVKTGWIDFSLNTQRCILNSAFAGCNPALDFETGALPYKANYDMTYMLSQMNITQPNGGVLTIGFEGDVTRLAKAFKSVDNSGPPSARSMLTIYNNTTTNYNLTGAARTVLTAMGLDQSDISTVFGPWTTIVW